MDPSNLPGLTNLERILIFAVLAEGSAVIALFWQIMKVRDREVETVKVISPLIAKLIELTEKFLSHKSGD